MGIRDKARIAELEAELAALKGEPAPAKATEVPAAPKRGLRRKAAEDK